MGGNQLNIYLDIVYTKSKLFKMKYVKRTKQIVVMLN